MRLEEDEHSDAPGQDGSIFGALWPRLCATAAGGCPLTCAESRERRYEGELEEGEDKGRGCSSVLLARGGRQGWPRRSSSSRRWPRPRHARHAAVCLPGEEDKGEWAGPGKLGLACARGKRSVFFFLFFSL